MRTWITRDRIDPADVLPLVGGREDGATVLFLGHVRDTNEGRRVTGMHYEAYVEMAEPVLAEIASDAAASVGSEHIVVVHRIGELDVGEVSVAIAVSSPHRAGAFDACRRIIEQIKARLPVWKQERYADAAPKWLPGHAASAEPSRE